MTVQTFSRTGAAQTFTWPTGVTTVTVEVIGGAGESGNGDMGGYQGMGGKVTGTLTKSTESTLQINVGSGGAVGPNSGRWNGGGTATACYNARVGGYGGDASDIRQGGTALANRVVVAGGGGAGGSGPDEGDAGGRGGDSAGTTGGAGAAGQNGSGGGGGTPSAGGAGGTGHGGVDGAAGSLGQGGTGGGKTTIGAPSSADGGGGGGGGYYGGGGGEMGDSAVQRAGGAGGAGSCYSGGLTSAAITSSTTTQQGTISLTYTLPAIQQAIIIA